MRHRAGLPTPRILRALEGIQRRVTKWIAGTDTYVIRLRTLNLLPLSLFLQLTDLLMLSRIVSGFTDIAWQEHVTFCQLRSSRYTCAIFEARTAT